MGTVKNIMTRKLEGTPVMRCLLCGFDFTTMDWKKYEDAPPEEAEDRCWMIMDGAEEHMMNRHADAW